MTSTETVAPAEVLWRSMSVTRLLDIGVDYADVLSLQKLTGEGMAWDVAAEQIADEQLARAEHAAAAGHFVTAGEAYRASIACVMTAQMAYNFDTDRKVELYGRLTEIAQRAAELSAPVWERVELPLGTGHLYGWLVAPQGPVTGTVVIFGGQSGWGLSYLRAAEALNRRGIAALLAEGPGQGDTRMRGGVLLDVDVRAAYSSFVSYLTERPELGACVGLWGNSLGGLYAGTTAASDSRVTAVCVNGAPAKPTLMGMRTFDEQAAAMLGVNDEASVQRNFDRISLQSGDRIGCPVLVLHGEQDPIVSLAEQQPFLDAAPDGQATLKTWADGEHTIYNHGVERTAFVSDWFVEQFAAAGADRGNDGE